MQPGFMQQGAAPSITARSAPASGSASKPPTIRIRQQPSRHDPQSRDSPVEWLFRKATQRVRGLLDTLPSDTVEGRLHLVGLRFAFAIGLVAAFALGGICPFLAFDWPPRLRQMLFGLLIVFLIVRIANSVVLFLLAPHHEP